MVNPYTKFEVFSFSRSRDISEGVKFKNMSRDPNHAPFGGDFSSAGWDCHGRLIHQIWSLYLPNYKDMKSGENVQIGVV